MNCELVGLSERDREAAVDIFNYYVENGFAAYFEEKVPYEFFDHVMQLAQGYSALAVHDRDAESKTVGFAFMRAYHPAKTFHRTAEVTYFIHPEYTRRGIGGRLVEYFTEQGPKLGVDCLLANVSSLNEDSIGFHQKMLFEECGRFRHVGKKFGKDFDVIWMQRFV